MENRATFLALIGTLAAVAWSAPTTADTAIQSYELDLKRCDAGRPLPDGTTECDLYALPRRVSR